MRVSAEPGEKLDSHMRVADDIRSYPLAVTEDEHPFFPVGLITFNC